VPKEPGAHREPHPRGRPDRGTLREPGQDRPGGEDREKQCERGVQVRKPRAPEDGLVGDRGQEPGLGDGKKPPHPGPGDGEPQPGIGMAPLPLEPTGNVHV